MAIECGLLTSWTEINAWAQSQNMTLAPFESEAIYAMGRAFTNAYSEYDRSDLPRPYYNREAHRNESAIRNALRGN
jgi:hypothetical protein